MYFLAFLILIFLYLPTLFFKDPIPDSYLILLLFGPFSFIFSKNKDNLSKLIFLIYPIIAFIAGLIGLYAINHTSHDIGLLFIGIIGITFGLLLDLLNGKFKKE